MRQISRMNCSRFTHETKLANKWCKVYHKERHVRMACVLWCWFITYNQCRFQAIERSCSQTTLKTFLPELKCKMPLSHPRFAALREHGLWKPLVSARDLRNVILHKCKKSQQQSWSLNKCVCPFARYAWLFCHSWWVKQPAICTTAYVQACWGARSSPCHSTEM